ncbi:phosphoribosyltransferase [Streptomonospora salina]|uniref:Putative phosphoribosyl transferase n=1 Tax=Streptomonospora salina TaxID=104205 RepID=A0A841EFY2_9ACTN|nr:phosphoribosyltransferase family protein [Streptomonospora salina]MBB6001204.1 putative phosphoribosyl transferase [Streptomonospora salina]
MSPLPVSLPFTDRSEAGRGLAERARPYLSEDPVALALPRGGVPVGAELARLLRIPLDVVVVRKIGAPGHPELGVGALAEDGHVCYDDRALARMRLTRRDLDDTVAAERSELERRLDAYRGAKPALDLRGRDVIVVDDGVATGGTARAALRAVRRRGPSRLLLGAPVAAQSALDALGEEADRIVALTVPDNFRAVGEWYRDFHQLSDDDVTALIGGSADTPAPPTRAVRIRAGDVGLDAELSAPPGMCATVVVALDQGCAAPAQRALADALGRAGYATLLLDLLTPDEAARRRDARDSGGGASETGEVSAAEAAERLAAAVAWLRRSTEAAQGRVGVLGSQQGVPAALMAAAANPADIAAVVLDGGRLDSAAEALADVRAPVLALVQGSDSFVRELAEWSLGRLGGPGEIRHAPGAEGLIAGAAVWRQVGSAAAEWFGRYL